MMKEKVYKEYTGTVVFLKANDGSKSEGVFSYIYVNRDTIVKIQKEDDNPFENESLVAFDGNKVKIKGYEGRSNTFMVTEIITENLDDTDNKVTGEQ